MSRTLDKAIDLAVEFTKKEKGRELTPFEVQKIESEFIRAHEEYPDHHPLTALANYRAGREVYDTNGDLW